MNPESLPLFVFLVSTESPAANDKLKTSGIPYRRKMLESSPANWARIADLLEESELAGVVVRMNPRTVEALVGETYAEEAVRILHSLRANRHVLFVHENILTGENPYEDQTGDELDEFDFLYLRDIFQPPSEAVREKFRELVVEHGLNLVPYRTNAEMSVLMTAFIEDHNKKLLFRLYVPSGRMWANEADKFLGLFRDWLFKVKKQRVRQDGYSTPQGEVYEFYGENELIGEHLARSIHEFGDFLDLCIDDPDSADRLLRAAEVDGSSAVSILERYGKEARRLRLDLRQQRESRILGIRHRLESELMDDEGAAVALEPVVQTLVPGVPAFRQGLDFNLPASPSIQAQNVTINQNFIGKVKGVVASEIQGNVSLTPEANKLLEQIQLYAGSDRAELESAVHEMEDDDAKGSDRLAARQKIKSFLFAAAPKLGGAVLATLQKYIDSKLGL